MVRVIQVLYNACVAFDNKHKDLRAENLLLIGSPWKLFALSLLYYLFVMSYGRKLMKNRQPFELKYLLMIYNLLQVAANLIFVYISSKIVFFSEHYKDGGCMLGDMTTSPQGMHLLHLVHSYFILKLVDYLDTIFFVLRKSYKQITFLHVYHHIGMAIGAYAILRYKTGGHIFILGYVNVFVHAIMYFYYFISALRSDVRNSISWKKYITQVQMLQFIILIVHFVRPLLRPDCPEPKWLMAYAALQNLIMLLMFSDFYIKTYIRKRQARSTKQN